MHLLIPFASTPADACRQAASDLRLPNLQALLARLTPGLRDEADEYQLSPPHERALARAWGWQGADGALPFAADAAAQDGIATDDLAWGLLTPLHWHVGAEHLTILPPAELQLAEAESRDLCEAARPLFEDEGWALVWAAPQRWYVAHESLHELPTASLDRVVGRNPDLWMPDHPQARLLRRLQNEVQMLWYTHPVNDAREARGALPVNSVWLSGCGMRQARAGEPVTVHDALRQPVLAEDWAAWADAWRALDAGPLREAVAALQRGTPVQITLTGERNGQTWASAPGGVPLSQRFTQRLLARFRQPDVPALLAAL